MALKRKKKKKEKETLRARGIRPAMSDTLGRGGGGIHGTGFFVFLMFFFFFSGEDYERVNNIKKTIFVCFAFHGNKSVLPEDTSYIQESFLKNVPLYFWYLFVLPANRLKKLKEFRSNMIFYN